MNPSFDSSRVKRQFIDGQHGQLHLRVAGRQHEHENKKPAVLCLHMMPKSGRGFARLLPELAKDRLVIAPDYPGYGESDHYPLGYAPSIADYADAIYQVIEHFNLEQVHLLGYHTGSMVAVDLALRYPSIVGKLINISAPILSTKEADDFKQYFAPIPLDKAGTRFSTMWERVIHYRGPGMTLEMAAISMAENLRGGDAYEDGHYAAFDYSQQYKEDLGRIDQPVLVMNLGDDLCEHSKRVDAYLNNGRRVDYPHWGHGFLELWPDQAAEVMLNFFDSELVWRNVLVSQSRMKRGKLS